ncbi:hypothetical protein WJX77_001629 [Trebouxia sp. C0004]
MASTKVTKLQACAVLDLTSPEKENEDSNLQSLRKGTNLELDLSMPTDSHSPTCTGDWKPSLSGQRPAKLKTKKKVKVLLCVLSNMPGLCIEADITESMHSSLLYRSEEKPEQNPLQDAQLR